MIAKPASLAGFFSQRMMRVTAARAATSAGSYASMTKRLLVVIACAGLVLLLYLAGRHSLATHGGSAKLAAPDFSLVGLDGSSVSLTKYRGKVVLLNFWATWCEPCRKEIPEFMEFQNNYGPRGFQVLGISMDDDAKPVLKFRDEFHVNYPIVMGSAAVGESYGGVLGLPITFLIDREGRIYAKHIGAANSVQIETEIRQLLSVSEQAGP